MYDNLPVLDKFKKPEGMAPQSGGYANLPVLDKFASKPAAPLPAATAPAGPAPAQAVASAPVIPSAPDLSVSASPLPQAQPAAPPAAPRFGQPGYNPLLHGGDGKPPLDLRINRALGIKDYRDEGPPTMSEVRARQSPPAEQAQAQAPAPINPVIEPGVVTPIDDRPLLQRMVRPPTDNEIMYGSRDEQYALVRRELGLPPLTQESEERVSAVIDAVPGEEKDEASFGEKAKAFMYGANETLAPTHILSNIGNVGSSIIRGTLEFFLTPRRYTGDFEEMMDSAARAAGVDPESTFSKQLKHELAKDSYLEERHKNRLRGIVERQLEVNGIAGAYGAEIADGIVGLIIRLAIIKRITGMRPGQTGGASGNNWVESWAKSAVKTATHSSRIALLNLVTTPGTDEEREIKAITTLFYTMTPVWSVGIPSNFITPIFDIGSNFWISNQLGVYDGAIEQAKAEHGDEWKLNLWRHLTPEMVLDGATNIAFGMLTRSATADFLNAKVSPYITEVARELKRHGSTEPLIIDLQTKMDAALKQAETARASLDRNAVDVALETYQFLRSAHESLVSDATRQSAPASAPEDRMDYSGIRPEQDDLDATRAAAAEALGTPRIGAEAQMEAERGAVPVSGDAWRQIAGVEAPSSAARVNPLLEPERVAQPAAQAERSAEPQAEAARPAEKVAAPEAARPPIEQARDEAGSPRQAPPAPVQPRPVPTAVAQASQSSPVEIVEKWIRPDPTKKAIIDAMSPEGVGMLEGIEAKDKIDKEFGQYVEAHGISKGHPTDQVRQLQNILDNGIDPNRTLHVANLTRGPEDTQGSSQTGGGTANTSGLFVIAGKKGGVKNGNFVVLVNPVAPQALMDRLKEMYPSVTFAWLQDAQAALTQPAETKGAINGQVQGQAEEVATTPEDRVAKKQDITHGDAWDLMSPAIRGVVTTDYYDGKRSDALKKWSEIPEVRREAYKKAMPIQNKPGGYSYLPPGYVREGDLYVFKGEAQGEKPSPRTAADLAKPAQAQEPASVAESAQEPAMEKPTTPLAKAVAEAPQAFRVTSSRGNVHNVKMPDGVTYPIRAESKAEAVAKAQELASKTKPLSEMNDADLKKRAEELGVSYDPKSTAKELRDRIRAAQQGGFIDVSPRAPSKDDPPFVRQMKENDRRVHEWQKRHTRDAISALRSEVVDRQADVKRALKGIGANDAIRRLVLRQGSGAEAARQFRVAEKSITDVLPTRDRELFKYYLQAMRVVEATQVQAERGIELKSPMSAEDAKLFLNDDFVKLPQDQQDAVMGAAKKYWGVMREQLDALYAEGLIGKDGYEAIATKHQFYSPRRFVEFIDPQTVKPKGEIRHDSGVDALDRGSESAMAADPMYLMAHVITRTQNRLFRNRANKALYDTAIASPENSIARVLGKNETPTRTEDSVSVFIDGQEVRMAMPKELAAEWDGLPPALSRNIAELLQWASGTKVLKTLATGVNPEFAISNLPRDAMYAWFTSGQYSSVLPKAIGQILLDYKRSMRDARKRTGAYIDYVKEGGGMDFLTTQGMTRKPGIEGGHRLARKIGDILAWAGETSEIATRLAVRNRAIRNGLSPEEATYVARNMLDFSQGGTFAKAADNVIPYLNAAIQGTRGGFRAFKENPKVASFKAAQLIAIGYGLAQVAATFTPELWDSINEREKASKWIIPLSWTRKDKEGNDRHAYIAIPKDQFQQVFAAIGQSFVDGVRGNPWKLQIIDSLFSTIPVEASSTIPPIMNAALAYFGNYDTWTKENVWQGYEDISPSKEQSWQTPEIAVDIAELASRMGVEISPERLATATGKVVPTSNPLGSIMSSIYATGNPDPELGRTIVEKLRDIPGIRRVLRFSRPSNLQKFTMDKAYQYNVDVAGMTDLQAREAIKIAERKRADVRYPLNIEADKIARQAVRGDVSSDDLQKWIDSVPQEERKRVESRIKAQYKKSWKSPSEIIRIVTDPGVANDPSKQANSEWLAKYGMDGMTAKDLRTALVKEAREQGWNTKIRDSNGELTAYGQRKLRLSRFIRKNNIE